MGNGMNAFCDLDLQFQGHWWPLKGQILAIFSHFGPVLIHRKLDHPMAGIYNTYICPIRLSPSPFVFCEIYEYCMTFEETVSPVFSETIPLTPEC